MLQVLRTLFVAEVVGDGVEGDVLGQALLQAPLQARLQVELGLADGRVLAGSFGSVTPDGGVLAARAETAWVVRFTRATWENLISQARALVR